MHCPDFSETEDIHNVTIKQTYTIKKLDIVDILTRNTAWGSIEYIYLFPQKKNK